MGNTSGLSGTGGSAINPQSAGVLAGDRPSGTRSDSYRHVPGGFPSPTPDESKTFLYYRDQVVPEPGVDGPVYHAHRGIHPEHQDGQIHPVSTHPASAIVAAGGIGGTLSHPTKTTTSGSSTAGPHSSDLLNKADPRVDSDLDGSRTTQGQNTFTGVPSSQHELRHTGSLDQPTSRSEHDDHHHGRDAAIAGGIGAGAAGLGYAATRDHDTATQRSGGLGQESSPYSSKQLDPRALGSKANLEDQKYDPQASSSHHTTPAVGGVASTTHGYHDDTVGSDKSTAGPHKSSLLNKLDPRVKNDSSKATDTTNTDSQSHHGRDAALVGGGVAAGAGARQALNRNDTPGAGTAILPQDETSRGTAPLVSSATTATSQHNANTSAPLSSSTMSQPNSTITDRHGKPYETYHGPKSTDGTPFYGAVGAPAPIEDRSHHPTTSSSEKDSHYGRDAGLAGAGLATAGGLAYAGQRDDKPNTGPGSSTIGPHSSNAANVIDPRVQPNPSLQKDHATTGPHQSDTLNRVDPKVDKKADHHYGRDAAVVGGVGAAGYGAHEAAQAYGDHRMTQPGASMNEQRYDTSATGANPAHPVPASGQYDYKNDSTGAGLGGAALQRHGDDSQVLSSSNVPVTSSVHDPSTAAYPTQGLIPSQHGQTTAPGTTTQVRKEEDHTKRNAALLGTGAAAVGAGAYAHSQNQDAEREKARLEKVEQERLKQEAHDREKLQHKQDKEVHKHDKAIAAHDKADHKHVKEEEKEVARLAKKREEETMRLEKENEPEKEKKHGILGFLHRDKSKKEKSSSRDNSPRQSGEVRRSVDQPRHSREYAAGGVALGAGTTAAAYDDNHGRNKLHKDPPAGHPAREALEHHEMGDMAGGKRTHMGVDGPIGDPNAISGYQ